MATKSIGKSAKASKTGEGPKAKAKSSATRSADGKSSASRTKRAAEDHAAKPKKPAAAKAAKATGHGATPEKPAKDAHARHTAAHAEGAPARGKSARPGAEKSPRSSDRKTRHAGSGGSTPATARSGKGEHNGHPAGTARRGAKRSGHGATASHEPRRQGGKQSRRRPDDGRRQRIASTLHQALESHASTNQLGRVTGEARFDWGDVENPDLRPDLAFVSFDRWAAYRHVPSALTWHVVPDLVVEILEESEKAKELGPRLNDYFKAGVNRVWVVDPRDLRVFDYLSASEYRILGPRDRLDGGIVMPGFQLEISELASR
jgi:Uma2 family endonuclease